MKDLSYAQYRTLLQDNPSVALPNGQGVLVCNEDFRWGPVAFITPGLHVRLIEDILFDCTTPPSLHAHGHGNHRGFFAVVELAADDITFDCDGHSLAMSERACLLHRFAALLQVGSRPFEQGAGPFREGFGPFVPAHGVKIINGTLGRNSHFAVHGNQCQRLTMENLIIKDFEVAGLFVNGARALRMKSVTLGPNRVAPLNVRWSQFQQSLHDLITVPADFTLDFATERIRAGDFYQDYCRRLIDAENHICCLSTAEQVWQYFLNDPFLAFFCETGFQAQRSEVNVFGIVVNGTHQDRLGSRFLVADVEAEPVPIFLDMEDVAIHALQSHLIRPSVLQEAGKDISGGSRSTLALRVTEDFRTSIHPLLRAQLLIYAYEQRGTPSSETLQWLTSGTPEETAMSLQSFPSLQILHDADGMMHKHKGTIALLLRNLRGAQLQGVQVARLTASSTFPAHSCSLALVHCQDVTCRGCQFQGDSTIPSLLQFDRCSNISLEANR